MWKLFLPFAFSIIVFCHVASAQSRKIFDFSVGPSFYPWYLQGNDLDDSKMLGYRADLQFYYQSSRRIGFTSLLRGQFTTKDSGKRYPKEFKYNGTLNSVSLQAGAWSEFRLSEKLSLNVNVMLGLIIMSYPERKRGCSMCNPVLEPYFVDQAQKTDWGFAGTISTGLRYDLRQNLYLTVKADVSWAYINFEYDRKENLVGSDFTIFYRTYNPGVGVGMKF